MSKPAVKVGRRSFDVRYAEDVNLAFSSELKTPKIYAQKALLKKWEMDDVVSPVGASGEYKEDGTHNGKVALTNGDYWIWWDGVNTWNLTGTKGSGVVIFYMPPAFQYGPEDYTGDYLEGTGEASSSIWHDGGWVDVAEFYRQSSVDFDNPLGYVPTFTGFRGLGPNSMAGGTPGVFYEEGQYTYYVASLDYDPQFSKYDGTGISMQTGDETGHVILSLDPLEGVPPSSYLSKGGPHFLLGGESKDVRKAFPFYNSVDSRFDTYKIFKTGTLTLNLPEETVGWADEDAVSHTVSVEHNLGYPPVYLPEVGVGWSFFDSWHFGNSAVVNDELGQMTWSGYLSEMLDVYVDSQKLYMRFTRGGGSYPAQTITMYYTLFYNDITEQFDLLTN